MVPGVITELRRGCHIQSTSQPPPSTAPALGDGQRLSLPCTHLPTTVNGETRGPPQQAVCPKLWALFLAFLLGVCQCSQETRIMYVCACTLCVRA